MEQQPVRSEFLLKIFCSKDIPVRNVIEKIEKMREDCEEELKLYFKIKNMLNSSKLDKKNLVLWISTINFGIYDCESKLKWCDETIETLENIKDL